jgi:hypothetical protein
MSEFAAIAPDDLARLPRGTLISLLTRMNPEVTGLELREHWELLNLAHQYVKWLRKMESAISAQQSPTATNADTNLIDL